MPPKRYFDAVDTPSDDTHAEVDAPQPAAKKVKKILPNVAEDVSATTVHATGLPESCTTEQLSTMFSDVGPIKSAFVVADRITGLSKGYGFVKFVLQADAEEAISTLNATQLDGKKIKVAWANRRQREPTEGGEVKSVMTIKPEREKPKWMEMKEQAKARAAANPRPAAFQAAKYNSLKEDPKRTVVVRGLPTGNDADTKKALYKKVKKLMVGLPNVAEDAVVVVDYPVNPSDPVGQSFFLCVHQTYTDACLSSSCPSSNTQNCFSPLSETQ